MGPQGSPDFQDAAAGTVKSSRPIMSSDVAAISLPPQAFTAVPELAESLRTAGVENRSGGGGVK